MTEEQKMTREQATLESRWLDEAKALYEQSFPDAERVPFGDVMRLVDEMPLDFTCYFSDGSLVGLFIVYPHERFNWFWYFAVVPSMRGHGYGQQILSDVLERYRGRLCVLDMESPRQPSDNLDQRMRRLAFYGRNGFRDTEVERSYSGITFTIMLNGEGTFTHADYDEIVGALWNHWQPAE